MQNLAVLAFGFPFGILLFCLFLPNSVANRQVSTVRNILTFIVSLHALSAAALLAMTQIWGPLYWKLWPQMPLSLSFYVDGVSAMMLTLVASVGWVICRFSIRYLDGESQQGRYFRWTAFTIGAVSMAVVAGNLFLLTVALLLTSVGLHQLLTHYKDRPAAGRAAAIKFVFSRLGDVCLLVATFCLYREFGSFELPELFASVGNMTESDIAGSVALRVASWSLVLCAVFKSAQFPFHTWLPETMEAPTPVSALMHAGIVNAGGYLLIRMAPVVTTTPIALLFVAGLGFFTAVFAALVMMSQTSVKQKLAWSTIAQMGFMIFQCGLGAFSAAMLHIIAHSLYKAHAFLSSGNVMNERAAMAAPSVEVRSPVFHVFVFGMTATVSVGLFWGIASALGISPETKPGGLVLGFVMCLGIAHWMRRNFVAGRSFVLPSVVISAGLMLAYLASFAAVDTVVSSSFVGSSFSPAISGIGFPTVIMVAFAVLLIVEGFANRGGRSKWLSRLYVHSSNGFYVDLFWRRAAKSVSA